MKTARSNRVGRGILPPRPALESKLVPFCRPSTLAPVLFLALCTCAGTPRAAGPEPASARIPIPQVVRAARARARADDRAGTMQLLGAAQPLDVRTPERAWLVTMFRPAQCESRASRQAVLALPPSDIGYALRAMTDENVEHALARLENTPTIGCDQWVALAKARLAARVGDTGLAARAAACAATSRRDFVRHEAALLTGRILLAAGELDGAQEEAFLALTLDSTDARVRSLLARIHDRAGRLDDAVLQRYAAVRLAPDSERYARDLLEQLEVGASPQVWGALDRGLPVRASNPELVAVRGRVAVTMGRTQEGIEAMRRALAAGALDVPLDRHLRHALVKDGRYTEAHRLLRRAIPPGVRERPENLRRQRWQTLDAAVEAAPNDRAAAPAQLALARAYVGVGGLDEAFAIASGLPGSEAQALARRVGGQRAFEAALRAYIEEGYRASLRSEDPPTFQAALARMRCLAYEHLAPEDQHAFRQCGQAARSIPFLGCWLDHRTDTASPVVAHFRRYGKFILFGQQREGPPEAIVLSLASLTRSQAIRSVGCQYRHDVAIGYDNSMRAFVTASGAGLGGACLADGIWLDVDSARLTESTVRRALQRDATYLGAVRASGPLPADTLDGPHALSDPGCTALRLFLRYVERNPDQPWGSYWALEAHEHGHVADIRRHLPIMKGLPATISLLVSKGFSPEQVEMELERRAQLAAVVDAKDPDFALAEMLLALPLWERTPGVHDGGYAQGLRQMTVHIATHPERYPQIDPTKRIVTQLDRLSNEEIRALACTVLCR